MKTIEIDGEIIEVDDSPLDPYETGRIIPPIENNTLADTAVIKTIDEGKLLEETNTNIFGDNNE